MQSNMHAKHHSMCCNRVQFPSGMIPKGSGCIGSQVVKILFESEEEIENYSSNCTLHHCQALRTLPGHLDSRYSK